MIVFVYDNKQKRSINRLSISKIKNESKLKKKKKNHPIFMFEFNQLSDSANFILCLRHDNDERILFNGL